MHNHIRIAVRSNGRSESVRVRNIGLCEPETMTRMQLCETCFFEIHLVIIVEIIDPENFPALIEKTHSRVKADEASGTCDDSFHKP